MAFAPPHWRICSSSFLICVTRSIIRRVFFSNSADLVLTFVFRVEAATRSPQQGTSWCAPTAKLSSAQRRKRPSIRLLQEFRERGCICAIAPIALVGRYTAHVAITLIDSGAWENRLERSGYE